MTILIADDDAITRKIIKETIEDWGHDVIVASDGQEALDAYKADPEINVAILDWMMPNMTGLEACEEIRKIDRKPSAFILVLTSRTSKKDLADALHRGADDYVTKPFDLAELQARIDVGSRLIDLQLDLQTKIIELKAALEEVKQLQGIIPMCAWCKRIRDDSDYWSSVETYISEHSEIEFSHGICPDCFAKEKNDVIGMDKTPTG